MPEEVSRVGRGYPYVRVSTSVFPGARKLGLTRSTTAPDAPDRVLSRRPAGLATPVARTQEQPTQPPDREPARHEFPRSGHFRHDVGERLLHRTAALWRREDYKAHIELFFWFSTGTLMTMSWHLIHRPAGG